MLELCNYLNISLSELFIYDIENPNYSVFSNPFDSNRLYVYYYTGHKLMTSILDIYYENDIPKCRFFNGIKNVQTYRDCSYYYEGILETDNTTAYFSLNNSTRENILEKVQIVVNIPWSNKITICKGLIVGLTPNSLPVVKKVILSSSIITDISKYNDSLIFSKDDSKKIFYDNALIIENKNYDEFFFDC